MSAFYRASPSLASMWWLLCLASKCPCGFHVWFLCGFHGGFVWLLVAATRGFEVSLWLLRLASMWYARVASCGCDTWLRRVSVASMSGFYLAFMRGFLWLRQMASTCLCGFHVWLLCGIHVWFRVSSLLQCCVIALSVYVAGDM